MRNNYLCILFVCMGVMLSQAQIITIPDSNFKNALLSASPSEFIAYNANGDRITIDQNANNEIEESEALLVYRLALNDFAIQNLTGISFFTNLTILGCGSNSITSLDLSALNNLEILSANNNNLTTINLSGLSQLEILNLRFNQLTALNLLGLTSLVEIYINQNEITSLDLTDLSNLEKLFVTNNRLNSLDISNNSMIKDLYCGNNTISVFTSGNSPSLVNLYINNNELEEINLSTLTSLDRLYIIENDLTSLDVSNNSQLNGIWADKNMITSLDVSNLTNLALLEVNNNALQYLNLKNGVLSQNQDNHYFDGNPSLEFVCVDDGEAAFIEQRVLDYGYTNCTVSSNCILNVLEVETEKFSLYPNPASKTITIQKTNNIEISWVEVYTILGQLITQKSNLDNTNQVDISQLPTGNFILKLYTTKGVKYKKFIKK